MDLETLRAEHPDLVQAIVAEAQTGMTEAVAAARAEGASAENQRIKDVRAQLIPGHEALIESLAFDGQTTGPMAAVAIVNAEKGLRNNAAQNLDADAPPVVPVVQDDAGSAKTMKRSDFNALTPLAQRAAIESGTKVVD